VPSGRQTVTHRFSGGWATDFGTYTDAAIGQDGKIAIPFLLTAENCHYELDGAPHKIGGLTKLNTSALTGSGSEIVTGMFDYWKQTSSLSATQKRVCHVNTITYDLNAGAQIATGLTANAVPNYNVFDNVLIYSSDATGDVPRKWDQSTPANLGGSPPNFSFSVTHKNRLFAAGVGNNGSRLYYTTAEDAEGWAASGSGEVLINPDDGDRITALKSWRGELLIFKGPYKGSIHRLVGDSPGNWTLSQPFAHGIGAAAQNLVFEFGNDIGFMWSDGSVHSLRDTATSGVLRTASLSAPINSWLHEHVVPNRLKYAQAAVDPIRGIVIFVLSVDSATENNVSILMDYRFDPVRWAYLPSFSGGSIANMIDPTKADRPILWLGGNDAFVRRFNQADRSIDTSDSYTFRVNTPFINYGDPFIKKHIDSASLQIVPKGNHLLYFDMQRDDSPILGKTLQQRGGDVLGPATANVFVLADEDSGGNAFGGSLLGSTDGRDVYIDLPEGDEFRRIQYRFAQPGANQDAEVHAIGARIKPGSESLENPA
jgi:hypothetical protein